MTANRYPVLPGRGFKTGCGFLRCHMPRRQLPLVGELKEHFWLRRSAFSPGRRRVISPGRINGVFSPLLGTSNPMTCRRPWLCRC
jgi:hypothetical protein